jgi:hypothetical protein
MYSVLSWWSEAVGLGRNGWRAYLAEIVESVGEGGDCVAGRSRISEQEVMDGKELAARRRVFIVATVNRTPWPLRTPILVIQDGLPFRLVESSLVSSLSL